MDYKGQVRKSMDSKGQERKSMDFKEQLRIDMGFKKQERKSMEILSLTQKISSFLQGENMFSHSFHSKTSYAKNQRTVKKKKEMKLENFRSEILKKSRFCSGLNMKRT